MGKEKYRAVVLKAVNYSDHDKILTVFTQEAGKMSIVAKGAQSPKSKYIASAQMFSISEFVLSQNDTAKLAYVYSADTIKCFYHISDDIIRFCAASVCCELLSNMYEDGVKESIAFNLIFYTLDLIDRANEEQALLFTLMFMLKLLGICGIGLIMQKCLNCENESKKYFLDFEAGGTVCPKCEDFACDFPLITETEASYMNSLIFSDISAIKDSVIPDRMTIIKLLYLINDYYFYSTGKKLHSFSMLVSV